MPAAQHLFLRRRRWGQHFDPYSPLPHHEPSFLPCRWWNTYVSGLLRSDSSVKAKRHCVSPRAVWVFMWLLKEGGQHDSPWSFPPPPHQPQLNHKECVGRPATAAGACHQHIYSISTAYSPCLQAFCTFLCILDLFLAPAVMDFPFACVVHYWECRIVRHSPSHTVCSMPFYDFALHAVPGKPCFSILWVAHLTLVSHCWGNTEGEALMACRQCRTPSLSFSLLSPSSLTFIILSIAPVWANCHFSVPVQGGGGGGG